MVYHPMNLRPQSLEARTNRSTVKYQTLSLRVWHPQDLPVQQPKAIYLANPVSSDKVLFFSVDYISFGYI